MSGNGKILPSSTEPTKREKQMMEIATRVALRIGREVYDQLNAEHAKSMAELERVLRAEIDYLRDPHSHD